MATTTTAPPDSGREEAPDVDVVVLAQAQTPTERELIAAWARAEHPGAPVLDTGDPALAERLQEAGDPLVLPARVTWLPRERDGDRRVRATDLLVLTNPHKPWPFAQKRIARREPDRARVTDGEPARLTELRARFREDAERTATQEAFGLFVARQAVLACERAERTVIGDRYKVPRLVAEQITASARFRAEVAKLAAKLDRPVDDVMADAKSCLAELATVQSRLAVDAFRIVLSPMHARAWTVKVDVESLERLRELNRKHALIFLPSHRSYVDPLVLGDVLHRHDFPPNHLLGGDNMNFFPIGPLGKRAGVIFIRRSFAKDAVYKLAIREYFGHLVSKRFNLEWYLEGGRTRTGKLRPPRFGLLHYLVHALEAGRAEDAVMVPVSIVYDQLHEVGAMAAEQGGSQKKGEGIRWLADYTRAQRRRDFGDAQVVFGEPFSLREAIEEAGEGNAQLDKIAFRILDGINRATPVTSTSLVTFALLGVRDRALTLDQVVRVVALLLDHIERRGIDGPIAELRRPAGVRRALAGLVDAGVVTSFEGGTEPVWSIAPGNHHVAAFYRNGALHHLVNRAILELALVHMASGPVGADPVDVAWEEALRLRDLLKFEFFFASKTRFRDELDAELSLLDTDWRTRVATPEEARAMLRERHTLVANRALRSFIDAQLVVALQLVSMDPRESLDRDEFMASCLGLGRQMVLQGRLHGMESVSQELYASALRLAANRDLVDPGREELRARRAEFLAEVEDVVGRLVRIGELDHEMLEEVLDDDAA